MENRKIKPEDFLEFIKSGLKEPVDIVWESPLSCYVLRSAPGGGKSFKANEIKNLYLKQGYSEKDVIICSADHYFTKQDGTYIWNGRRVQDSHNSCLAKFAKAVSKRLPCLIVDNTNLTKSEMFPYVRLATDAHYDVHIVEPTTPWAFDAAECFKRNTHKVPLETIEKMIKRYQKNLTIGEILS